MTPANFAGLPMRPMGMTDERGAPSIHHEQPRADRCRGAMCLGFVGDLVAHAGFQGVGAAVCQFGVEFAREAKEDVAFFAPMIGEVAGRVFDEAHADVAEMTRAPEGNAGFALMFSGRYLGPVSGAERDIGHLHLAHTPFVAPMKAYRR